MSNVNYICVRAWKRHSLGTIIPEWEYNKLPQEIKDSNSFRIHVEPTLVDKSKHETKPTNPIVPSPIKTEDDFRSHKRYNLPQNPVVETDGNGSKEGSALYD
jgi:hypothetical protein